MDGGANDGKSGGVVALAGERTRHEGRSDEEAREEGDGHRDECDQSTASQSTDARLRPDAAAAAAERLPSAAPDDVVVPGREGGRTSVVTSGRGRGRDQRREGGWGNAPSLRPRRRRRHPSMRKGPG